MAALAWALLPAGPARAEGPGRPAAESAAALIELARATTRTPGLAAAVAVGGELVWSGAAGDADLESEVPATPASRFRVGSVSKLLTVATLARLVQAKRIDLDAPIGDFLSEFPDRATEITLRHLAGHLGGIRHYESRREFMNMRTYTTMSEAVGAFGDSLVAGPPGVEYVYSSPGFVVLGAAIEHLDMKAFPKVAQEEVLGPLGLESTVPDRWQEIVPRRARTYSLSGDAIINSPPVDLSDRWSSGGYLSTVEDLARLGAAHLGEGFLTAELRGLIFTSQRTADGEETGVGLGWRIERGPRGATVYHHAGSAMGGRAVLAIFPESGVTVAIVGNRGLAGFGEAEAQAIEELFAASPAAGGGWEPAGAWKLERPSEEGPLEGALVLRPVESRARGSLDGTLRMGDGPEMPVAWSLHRGRALTLAAVDPEGRLEILWLTGEGDQLSGREWGSGSEITGDRFLEDSTE